MANDKKPTPDAIRGQLGRILQNSRFRGSDKQRQFLGFVVNETLAGNASLLKGYTVAVSVYGRKVGFDPQADPIVRVEARRLRNALEHYYLTAGKNDPVRIEIPKGGYVPTFQTGQIQPSSTKAFISEGNDTELYAEPSIAVMPLLNLTGDEKQEYFVDGLTEELTAEVVRYQELLVIASQSAMRFKGEKVDLIKTGRELGVRFLLAGSVQKSSQKVKVSIRLLDTATAGQIWGKSYTSDLEAGDLIELQEKIASRVAGTIADKYGLITRKLSREARKKAPSALKAYDAILRFYHYEMVLTPEVFKDALTALEQAVAIEPEYGLAWAMLGHLHADNYAMEFCEVEAPLEKALQFAQKGVVLAPENQFAQDALSVVYFQRGNKDLFLKQAEATILLNPNSAYIVGVAGWHMSLFGEWERGLSLLEKGIRLNPYHPTWFYLAPFCDHYRRDEYEKAFVLALKFNYPGLFWDPVMRAASLGQMGRAHEAETAIGELFKLVPEFTDRGRRLISRYVKVDSLVDKIIEGLQKAGLGDID